MSRVTETQVQSFEKDVEKVMDSCSDELSAAIHDIVDDLDRLSRYAKGYFKLWLAAARIKSDDAPEALEMFGVFCSAIGDFPGQARKSYENAEARWKAVTN